MMRKSLQLCLAASLSLIAPGSVLAAASNVSELNMLWDEFLITGGVLCVDYETRWIYYGAHSEAQANTDYTVSPPISVFVDMDSKSTNNPLASATAITNAATAHGMAFTSGSLARARSDASANGLGDIYNSWANGNAHFRWDLTALKDVTLTFSIPYTYHYLFSADTGLDHASAYPRPSFYAEEYVFGPDWSTTFLTVGEDYAEINHALYGRQPGHLRLGQPELHGRLLCQGGCPQRVVLVRGPCPSKRLFGLGGA